jgi:hypothetical protein
MHKSRSYGSWGLIKKQGIPSNRALKRSSPKFLNFSFQTSYLQSSFCASVRAKICRLKIYSQLQEADPKKKEKEKEKDEEEEEEEEEEKEEEKEQRQKDRDLFFFFFLLDQTTPS